jgi:hypothetical protein
MIFGILAQCEGQKHTEGRNGNNRCWRTRPLRAQTDPQEEEQLVRQARQWLSRPDNDSWLVVYDNYDDPRLPELEI